MRCNVLTSDANSFSVRYLLSRRRTLTKLGYYSRQLILLSVKILHIDL